MNSMFEQLRELPLFQGTSEKKLAELVEKVPFHFLKFTDGEQIIRYGEQCTHIKFIISGSIRIESKSNNLDLAISQLKSSPEVVGPDFLFGRYTAYPFDAFASGECGILQLLKSDYIKILKSDDVFLFNMLNYLSLSNQKFIRTLSNLSVGNVETRLSMLVSALTTRHSQQVSISFQQKDLCTFLGTQRKTLLQTLDQLTREGLIAYTNNRIDILDLKGITAINDAPAHE